MRTVRILGSWLMVIFAVVATWLGAGVPTASAAPPGTPYSVTFVARQCSAYTDITANLARNNIMESLQDLGADTAYTSGQAIDPKIEDDHQPNCTPLNKWKFTLGSGIAGKVDGLSIVSSPGTPFTVQASTPWLNSQGQATGRSIASAVTVDLTQSQADAALSGQNLWAQGGTPSDPLTSPNINAAFGALRCAVDNLNGDNVEWIGFPSNTHHVFCYYYAVVPGSKSGTIIVKKTLPNGQVAENEIPFQGNVSYNPGGNFSVAAGSSISFLRAAGVPWDFTELPTAGFGFVSVNCVSASGHSEISTTGARADVTLAADDTVTCTYLNSRNVTELSIYKQTSNAVGGPFSFSVTPPQDSTPVTMSASTADLNTPVLAGTLKDATIGTYVVTETLPTPHALGHWQVQAFDCNGVSQTPAVTQDVVITSVDEPVACTFTNEWIPAGTIHVVKISQNGTGSFHFLVFSPGSTVTSPALLRANTNAVTTPTLADQVFGEPVNPAGIGQYTIVELGARAPTDYIWKLVSVACHDSSTKASLATTLLGGYRVKVSVSPESLHPVCLFTNELVENSTTTHPPGGGGSGGGSNGGGGDLAYTGAPIVIQLLWTGAIMILAGLATVVVARRRVN